MTNQSIHLGILIFYGLLLSVPIRSQIAFEEVSAFRGVSHFMKEDAIGGGISLYDFNQDGLDDLTLSSYLGDFISFYINTGNGFELIPPLIDNREIVKQINWVDFDNDGDPDLYVAANDGINRLYENNGQLVLTDITEQAGLPTNVHYGYGACWGDYNRDGWLDLYYASKGVIGDPDAIRSYNRLFKNKSDGTFIERTFEAGVSDEGKLPFCASFIDYNNDMWPDIYIANDKLTFNTLLENSGNGAFEDVSVQTGANARMNAMCVNPGDYNRDGWMDIYVTNTPVGSQLLHNSGQLNEDGYIQLTNVANDLAIHFPGGNCWGSNFLDADNDGDLDLYISSSIPTPKNVSSAFYENQDGVRFTIPEIEGFLKDTAKSYTNAIGDINHDGLIDIVVQNNPPEPFYIWENHSDPSQNWLKVTLEGVLSNRDGIGVRMEAYIANTYQLQFTLCGSGFLGQNSGTRHFGLGRASSVDSLVVTWPSGHVDKLFELNANQVVPILEGVSTAGIIDVDEDVRIVDRNISTSIAFIEQQLEIQLWPNPAASAVHVKSDKKINSLEVVDARGRTIMKSSPGAKEVHLPIGQLPPGIYFLKIRGEQKNRKTVRWVKID